MSPGPRSSVGPPSISTRAAPSSTRRISVCGNSHAGGSGSASDVKRLSPARSVPVSTSTCSSAPPPISGSACHSSVEMLETKTPGCICIATSSLLQADCLSKLLPVGIEVDAHDLVIAKSPQRASDQLDLDVHSVAETAIANEHHRSEERRVGKEC